MDYFKYGLRNGVTLKIESSDPWWEGQDFWDVCHGTVFLDQPSF